MDDRISLVVFMDANIIFIYRTQPFKVMKVHTIKLDIIKKIIQVRDSNVLNKINKLLDEELIVGYTPNGTPINLKAYKKRIKKAERDVELNKIMSQDELKKESELW